MYQRYLFLLLSCCLHIKAYKTIKGNWDEIVNRRVGELRRIWPNCVMNGQFSLLTWDAGASLSPNKTVFRDINLQLVDRESLNFITTTLKEQPNGSVFWDLKTIEKDPSVIKNREIYAWNWGVNNTVSFDEAVRLIAASNVTQEPPAAWFGAEQRRLVPQFYEGFPDQVYWLFTPDDEPVYLGERDRIVRLRGFKSSPVKTNVTDIDSVLPSKDVVSETDAVTRKDFKRSVSRSRGRIVEPRSRYGGLQRSGPT